MPRAAPAPAPPQTAPNQSVWSISRADRNSFLISFVNIYSSVDDQSGVYFALREKFRLNIRPLRSGTALGRKVWIVCVCTYVKAGSSETSTSSRDQRLNLWDKRKKIKMNIQKILFVQEESREKEHDTSYENRSVDVMHWNQSTHLHLFQLGKAHGLMQIKEKSYYHPLLLPVDSSQRGNGTQEPHLFRALLLFSFSVCVFRTASTVCSMDCCGANRLCTERGIVSERKTNLVRSVAGHALATVPWLCRRLRLSICKRAFARRAPGPLWEGKTNTTRRKM